MNTTAALAHSITWKSSKQSYLTTRILADRDLVDDCLRGYAYFRWADDIIDTASLSYAERHAFISRQKGLIERLYCGEQPLDLCPEEMMLAELVRNDRGMNSGLRSFIDNFMYVIAFDAGRHNRVIRREELLVYTERLAAAVMDGIQYFIGNGHIYPRTSERLKAVSGAHITHMLRDMSEDLPGGIINIAIDDLQIYGIQSMSADEPGMRAWVRAQVKRARSYFGEGKRYIDTLDVLRCKLAGVWYCARFERILNAIERDGYRLRAEYPERHSITAWLVMGWLGIAIICKHYAGRFRQTLSRHNRPCPVRKLVDDARICSPALPHRASHMTD